VQSTFIPDNESTSSTARSATSTWATGTPSSFCTATQRHPTSGVTSSHTSKISADAWLPISLAWASQVRPLPGRTDSSTTPATSTRGSKRSVSNVTLVLHDWGSALGFYRAFRHPEQIRAIAYMESIVAPRRWEDFPQGRDKLFRALRSEEGERMVLEENFFIETVLPKSVIRQLSKEEMEAYRKPFKRREARLPTLVWPRELPIEGEPSDVIAIVQS